MLDIIILIDTHLKHKTFTIKPRNAFFGDSTTIKFIVLGSKYTWSAYKIL